MDAGYFKGTSAEQDNRFIDKNKKLMKTMKFAEVINTKIDMTKVDLEIIRPWINNAVTSYLGYEDDVVVEFTCSQLEQSTDSKQMQVNLTGFLGAKNAREFMEKLWSLLLSGMEDIYGVPEELKEQKKEQLRLKQAEQERLNASQKNQQLIIQEAIAKIKNNAALKLGRSPSPKPRKSDKTSGALASISRSESRNRDQTKQESGNTKDSKDEFGERNAGTKADETFKRGGSKWKFRQLSYGRNRMKNRSPPKYRKKEHSPDSDKRPERSASPRDRNNLDAERDDRSPRPKRSSPNRDLRRSRSGHGSRHGSRSGSRRRNNVSSDRRHKAEERLSSRNSSAENERKSRSLEKSSFNQVHRSRSRYDRPSPELGTSNATYPRDYRRIEKEQSLSPQRVATFGKFSPRTRSSPQLTSSRGRHFDPTRQSDLYPEDDRAYFAQRLLPAKAHLEVERPPSSYGNKRTVHNSRWNSRAVDQDPIYDYDAVERDRRAPSPVESRRRKNFSTFGETWDDSYESSRSRPRSRHDPEYRDKVERFGDPPSQFDDGFVTSEVWCRYNRAMEELYGNKRMAHNSGERRYGAYDRRHDQAPYKHVAPYDNDDNYAALSERHPHRSSSRAVLERSPLLPDRSFVRPVYDERVIDRSRKVYAAQVGRRTADEARLRDDYGSLQCDDDIPRGGSGSRRSDRRVDNLDRWESLSGRRSVDDRAKTLRDFSRDESSYSRQRLPGHRSSRSRSPRGYESAGETEHKESHRTSKRENAAPSYSNLERYRDLTDQEFDRRRRYRDDALPVRNSLNRDASRDRPVLPTSRYVDLPGDGKSDSISRWLPGGEGRKRDREVDLDDPKDVDRGSFSSPSSNSPVHKKMRTDDYSRDDEEENDDDGDDDDDDDAEVGRTEESEEKSSRKKKKKEKKKKRKKHKKHKKHKHRKSEDDNNSDRGTHNGEGNPQTPESE